MTTDSEPLDVKQAVLEARERIREHVLKTPLVYSKYLSELGGARVYFKLESHQFTGSFKYRGALNKLLSLQGKEVITASTGNHGLAVARALQITGGTGTIYLPVTATREKIAALQQYGVPQVLKGKEAMETEIFARNVAKREKKEFISPYNDLDIVAGQGTIGVELTEQLDRIDSILVSVGGGGLISGIAGYLKDMIPEVEIIGCLPENSPVMYESVRAGKIIDMEIKPTLSDGTAGGIEPGAITFELCQRFVDRYKLVSEEEIVQAVKIVHEKHGEVIEGAAGVSVAAYLKDIKSFKGKNVVIIICGKNISKKKLGKMVHVI